jgi:hypothetical protein
LKDNVTLEAIARDFDQIVVASMFLSLFVVPCSILAGDAGTHLAVWFASLIKAAGGDEKTPPTLLLFKTVHQRCIFPAFYCVRELLQEAIGKFKDKRGTWNVRIDLDPNNMSYVPLLCVCLSFVSHILGLYTLNGRNLSKSLEKVRNSNSTGICL